MKGIPLPSGRTQWRTARVQSRPSQRDVAPPRVRFEGCRSITGIARRKTCPAPFAAWQSMHPRERARRSPRANTSVPVGISNASPATSKR